MNYNILIVGVGGQGTLLASRVLGNYAALRNLDCKLSEVHGMAQRGGSVVTHVRMSDKVLSPIISEGDSDIILAFEKLEAMRWKHYLKSGVGKMIVNDQEIMPMPVITGAAVYPHDVLDVMSGSGVNLTVVNASDIALECGNLRVANTVMIGRLARELKFEYKDIEEALRITISPKILDINLVALYKGYYS